MKETIQEYFRFTRSERRGIILFLGLLLGITFFPGIYLALSPEIEYDNSAFHQDIERWKTGLIEKDSFLRTKYEYKEKQKNYSQKTKGWKYKKDKSNEPAPKWNLHEFDPNTIDKKSLAEMGFPEGFLKVFLNYRNKGGYFKSKEDLKRVYGFRENWYEEIEPFIRIEKKKEEKIPLTQNFKPKEMPSSYQEIKKEKIEEKKPRKKDRISAKVNINSASAEDFQKLKGIGPSYSKRIVKYRESLGGFHSKKQIAEVWGLPDSVYQKISPFLIEENTSPRKININTVDLDALKKHPYLDWKTAKALLKYRDVHGNFGSVEDLRKCYALPPETFDKLAPYLTIQ